MQIAFDYVIISECIVIYTAQHIMPHNQLMLHIYLLQVEVTWSLTLGTALPIDVSSLTGTQTIPDGDTSVYIDLSILDDTLPELMETFTIKLESVSPGAMIGSPQSATITIAPSDDPRGLFGE